MKKILLLALSATILFGSCSKSSSNVTPTNTITQPKDDGVFLLNQVTYGGSPLMTFKYNNNRIIEASNTYYKDVIAYKTNGQIDTVVTYFNGSLFRIKRVSYGSNNKVALVKCYDNGTLAETTTYTYDSDNRISSIVIVDGASNYLYNYSYNASGNQISYKETYTFNSQLNWTKESTSSSFDDKPNPFLTLPNFEYFFSNTYQSEYDRLGVPATLGKNNIVQASGKETIGTAISTGNITYGLNYDNNGYVSQMNYSYLVGGSLNATYGFSYLKAQ